MNEPKINQSQDIEYEQEELEVVTSLRACSKTPPDCIHCLEFDRDKAGCAQHLLRMAAGIISELSAQCESMAMEIDQYENGEFCSECPGFELLCASIEEEDMDEKYRGSVSENDI